MSEDLRCIACDDRSADGLDPHVCSECVAAFGLSGRMHHCRRCGHRWLSVKPDRPVQCPDCKAPNWWRPAYAGDGLTLPSRVDRLVSEDPGLERCPGSTLRPRRHADGARTCIGCGWGVAQFGEVGRGTRPRGQGLRSDGRVKTHQELTAEIVAHGAFTISERNDWIPAQATLAA